MATKNYKIVKTNVVGTSWGFSLLAFISLMSPDYAEAMAQLYQAGGITEGKAQAIVNVVQQNTSAYFILFGIPRITVRADVVEFTEALPREVLELKSSNSPHSGPMGHSSSP